MTPIKKSEQTVKTESFYVNPNGCGQYIIEKVTINEIFNHIVYRNETGSIVLTPDDVNTIIELYKGSEINFDELAKQILHKHQGQKIKAIKEIREILGWGLHEAKKLLDKHSYVYTVMGEASNLVGDDEKLDDNIPLG